MPAQVRLIANPNASQIEAEELQQAVGKLEDWQYVPSRDSDEVRKLAEDATQSGYDLVVAAGGDGTVHAAMQGLMGETHHTTAFAVLPLGTGNDFARSLGIPLDWREALAGIADGQRRQIDVICVHARSDGKTITHYCLNAASGGELVEAAHEVEQDKKELLGALAYGQQALSRITNQPVYELELEVDSDRRVLYGVAAMFVANGRSVGGGMHVAPLADLEDGLLNIIVLKEMPPAKLALTATKMRLGNFATDETIVRAHGKRIKVSAKPPMRFFLDGEDRPFINPEFIVVPNALTVVVGPEYQREPAVG